MSPAPNAQRCRGQIRVYWWRERGRGGITEDRVREELIALAQLVRIVLPVDAERLVRLGTSS